MIEPRPAAELQLGLPLTRPEDVGLSSERLARIDDHLRRRYLEPGKIADIVIWNAEHPAELAAQFGLIRPAVILRDGVQ